MIGSLLAAQKEQMQHKLEGNAEAQWAIEDTMVFWDEVKMELDKELQKIGYNWDFKEKTSKEIFDLLEVDQYMNCEHCSQGLKCE